MNDELAITLFTPGAGTRTYIFSEQPVVVGRSPQCHISICHQAVPRNLCSVWLEDMGKRVRVEENPGLTNPLLCSGVPVAGGVTGKRLDLSVGPIGLLVSPASRQREQGLTNAGPSRLRKGILAGVALLAVAVLCISFQRETAEPGTPTPEIPATPFHHQQALSPPDGLRTSEQADLLYSRAQALLDSRTGEPFARVRAAKLMSQSVPFLADESGRHARREEAEALSREVESDYRKEVLEMRRSLEKGDEAAAAVRADHILSYLTGAEFDGRGWLERLAHRSETESEVTP